MRECYCENCAFGKLVVEDTLKARLIQSHCARCRIEMIAGKQGNLTKWKNRK